MPNTSVSVHYHSILIVVVLCVLRGAALHAVPLIFSCTCERVCTCNGISTDTPSRSPLAFCWQAVDCNYGRVLTVGTL